MGLKATSETVKVSVIIPCFNEEATIARTLMSLSEQTFSSSRMEVWVVDGLSTDSTRKVIQAWSDVHAQLCVTVIDNPARKISHALNLGIASATGEIVVRMDAHAIPAFDYVARCVEHLVAGRGENVGGQMEVQASADTKTAQAIAVAAGHPLGSGGASYRSGGAASEVDTVLYGCYWANTLRRVGGYDETLLANEDYELNVRIRKSGAKIYFDPLIRCIYFSRPTYGRLWQQYHNYGYWKARMARRYPATLRLRQLVPPVLVSMSAASALFSVLLGVFWHPIGLSALPLSALIYATSLRAGLVFKGPRVMPNLQWPVVFALACMHFAWGSGFLKGCILKSKTSE